MSNRTADAVTEIRRAATQILTGLETLHARQQEINARGGGEWLTEAGAFVGAHEGLTATQVGAVAFDTYNDIMALLAQGHATNLHTIRE